MVTTPLGVILRILKLSESITYRFPDESIVIPVGPLKLAAVPVPSTDPAAPDPANMILPTPGIIL